jgi:small subunit ribosomal protein S16
MLMIRLARFGAKKKPFYRIVVIEKERARNGRALEVVGHYNPLTTPAQVTIRHDRVEHCAVVRHREASGRAEPRAGCCAGCLTLVNCNEQNDYFRRAA